VAVLCAYALLAVSCVAAKEDRTKTDAISSAKDAIVVVAAAVVVVVFCFLLSPYSCSYKNSL